MRRRAITSCLLLALSACGGAPLDAAGAAHVWTALESAWVARPIDIDYFRQGGVFSAATACAGGTGAGSAHTTFAFGADPAEAGAGTLSGTAVYHLTRCRGGQVAVDGQLRRGLHVDTRGGGGGGGDDDEGDGAGRHVDVFYGHLDVSGAVVGSCEVDVTRTIVGGRAQHEGTLCGHAAAQLLDPR